MALRAALLSPGSDSRLASSTEPRTTYLISRAGIHLARSESGGVQIGNPSAVRMRASDSPSSRPPSRRCTDTFTRVPCLASARGGAFGAGAAAPVGSGPPSAACVISTSLMECQPQPMIAPAYRYPTRLSETCRTSTRCPVALRWPASIEDPLRTRHALRHALDLGGTSGERGRARVAARLCDDDADRDRHELGSDLVPVALLVLDPPPPAVDQVIEGGDGGVEAPGDLVCDRLGKLRLGEDDEVVTADVAGKVPAVGFLLEDLEDDRGQRLDHVVASHEAVVVVVALEGVDVRIEDREAFVRDQSLRDLAQDVGVAAHPGERVELAGGRRSRDDGAQARHELLWDEGFGHVVVDDEDEISTRLGHLRRCLACGARPAHGTHDIPAAGSESGASARRRRSWSTSSSARSAAVRISAMSALTASGSLVSSAISSQ